MSKNPAHRRKGEPPMMRHLLDLPDSVKHVRLLCGPTIKESARAKKRCPNMEDQVISGDVALTTCIACLRAHAAKQEGEITRLRQRVEAAKAEVAELRAVLEPAADDEDRSTRENP